ncbi:unnamed protein product [Ixodes pacificus]
MQVKGDCCHSSGQEIGSCPVCVFPLSRRGSHYALQLPKHRQRRRGTQSGSGATATNVGFRLISLLHFESLGFVFIDVPLVYIYHACSRFLSSIYYFKRHS